jgi:hypothetical protein
MPPPETMRDFAISIPVEVLDVRLPGYVAISHIVGPSYTGHNEFATRAGPGEINDVPAYAPSREVGPVPKLPVIRLNQASGIASELPVTGPEPGPDLTGDFCTR